MKTLGTITKNLHNFAEVMRKLEKAGADIVSTLELRMTLYRIGASGRACRIADKPGKRYRDDDSAAQHYPEMAAMIRTTAKG